MPNLVETSVAPAAIERARAVYLQLQPRDQSVVVQARKSRRSTFAEWSTKASGGLAHLKALERDHDIKSAHGAEVVSPAS